MADILLFGATGFTGRLTARALAHRGVDFAIAGRDRAKLEALASETGGPDVRVARVGDVDALVDALRDVEVLITCVGPFIELGDTAVEAAIRAGVQYIDSTGEGAFAGRLLERHDARARRAGIALAPALGFDEVPADTAATLACEGMEGAEVVLTYAFPKAGSTGTKRSTLGIITSSAPWIVDGRREMVPAGRRHRWAPMPPPLGPRQSVSFPFSETYLAPLHLDLKGLEVYITTGAPQRVAMTLAVPALRLARNAPPLRGVVDRVLQRGPEGPTDEQRTRDKWTILAEARDAKGWRNIALQGADPYGMTAELLAAGALRMLEPDFDLTGVVAPVQVLGVDRAVKQLQDLNVSLTTYEPGGEGSS